MKFRELPSSERLNELLRFEPETGRIFWRKSGKEAGGLNSRGYRQMVVDGVLYVSHRIAFAMANGREPVALIDHINAVRDDNRPENLREATQAENLRNRGAPITNLSGRKGVSWCKKRNKWRARIKVDYKEKYLGYFDDPEIAGYAYLSAALKHHGEFAKAA